MLSACPPPDRGTLFDSLQRGGAVSGRSVAAAAWAAASQRCSGGAAAPSWREATELWQVLVAASGSAVSAPQLAEVLAGGGSASHVQRAQLRRLQEALVGTGGRCNGGGSAGGWSREGLWQRLQAGPAAVGDAIAGGSRASGSEGAPGAGLRAVAQHERHRLELAAAHASPPPYAGAATRGDRLVCAITLALGVCACMSRGRGQPRCDAHRLPPKLRPTWAPPTSPPGARRLLRWQQRVVFHAVAASEAHPRERKVALRVHAGELAHEAGLSAAALQHMLRVAGLQGQGGRCAGARERSQPRAMGDLGHRCWARADAAWARRLSQRVPPRHTHAPCAPPAAPCAAQV